MTKGRPVYTIHLNDSGGATHDLKVQGATQADIEKYENLRQELGAGDLDFFVPNRGAILNFLPPAGDTFSTGGVEFVGSKHLYLLTMESDHKIQIDATGLGISTRKTHRYKIHLASHRHGERAEPLHHGGAIHNGGSIP